MDNFYLEIHMKKDGYSHSIVIFTNLLERIVCKRQEHLAGNHGKCIEHAGAAYKMQLYTIVSVG